MSPGDTADEDFQTVLQPRRKWRQWLGILPGHLWLDKLGNLRLRHFLQPVLARRDSRLPGHAVPRSPGTLAADEAQVEIRGD